MKMQILTRHETFLPRHNTCFLKWRPKMKFVRRNVTLQPKKYRICNNALAKFIIDATHVIGGIMV